MLRSSNINLILFVFLIVAVLACSSNKEEVDELIELNDSEGLIEFIRGNYNDTDTTIIRVVDYSIKTSLKHKVSELYDLLETLYFNPTPSAHKNIIISSFANEKQVFKDSTELISLYISKVLEDNTEYSKHKKYIESIIDNYDNLFVKDYLLDQVAKEIRSVNYIFASNILSQYKNLGIILNKDELYTLSLLNELAFFEKSKAKSFSTFQSVNKIDAQIENNTEKYDKLIDQKSAEKTKLINDNSEFISNRNKLEKDIDELEKELEKSGYFWLRGSILGEIKTKAYEISIPYQRTHALLRTIETEYTSKGTFSLRVKKTGTSNVKLKEEFGSFTQEWDVYTEVTEGAVESHNIRKKLLNEKKSEFRALKNKSKNFERRLSKLNNELISLKNKNGKQFLMLSKKRDKAVDALIQDSNKLLFELKKMSAIIF